jgi:uncharacterized membrane protein
MKKVSLELLQVLAGSAFVGISLYGIFMYWGGETQEKIPASQSLLLGLAAVICITIFVMIGGLLDEIAAAGQAGSGTEQKDNG